MRRIYSAVLVVYNDSAWLAAFTARKLPGSCLTAIKDWHGRIEKSERSHDKDTEEIHRIGRPHGKEDPVRGLQHAERQFSTVCHVLHSNREVTLPDSLNSLILQTCGVFLLPITLGDHESYKPGSRRQRHLRRFLIAASMIQYGYEANAKSTRAARRDSEKNAADNTGYFHCYRR